MRLGRNLRTVGGLICRRLPETVARIQGDAYAIAWQFPRPIRLAVGRVYVLTVQADGMPRPMTHRLGPVDEASARESLSGFNFGVDGEPGRKLRFAVILAELDPVAESKPRVLAFHERDVRFPEPRPQPVAATPGLPAI